MNEHACKTRFHLKGSSQMSHSLVRNLLKWPKTVQSNIPINSCFVASLVIFCFYASVMRLSKPSGSSQSSTYSTGHRIQKKKKKKCDNLLNKRLQPIKRGFFYFGCSSAWLVVQRRKYHVTGLCKDLAQTTEPN